MVPSKRLSTSTSRSTLMRVEIGRYPIVNLYPTAPHGGDLAFVRPEGRAPAVVQVS